MKARAFTRKIFELIKSNWYMPVKSMYSYNEQEQKVGTWVNNFPVYEKTLFGMTPAATTPIGVVPVGDQISYILIDAPVDNVISVDALVRLENGVWEPMPLVNDTASYFGKISVSNDANPDNPNTISCIIGANEWIYRPLTVTIRYTKIGDSPETDKVPVQPLIEYTLKEQVVGYWVNGKPLYRKTVDIGALPNNSTKTVAHGISDLEFVPEIFGAAKREGSNAVYVPIPFTDAGSNNSIKVYCDNQNIEIQTASNRSDMTGYVTISYTKTTDY